MSYVVPNNRLYILSGVPIERNYTHTLYFTSQLTQRTYFGSKVKYSFTDMTHIRVTTPGKQIRVEVNVNDLYDCNYLIIENYKSGNIKTFYCFIDNVEYVNENVSLLDYTVDVMQTWFFDYTLNHCYVEREHTITDAIGSNLISEPINLGGYVVDDEDKLVYDASANWYIVIQSTADIFNTAATGIMVAPGNYYGGVYGNVQYLCFPVSSSLQSDVCSTIEGILTALSIFDNVDTIINMYMCPYSFLPTGAYIYKGNDNWSHDTGITFTTSLDDTYKTQYQLPLSRGYADYVPKNNKMLTYPYCFFTGTTYEGEVKEYKFEYFNDPTNIYFHIYCDSSIEPTAACVPMRYGEPDYLTSPSYADWNNSLQIRKFPKCCWAVNDLIAKFVQSTISIAMAAISKGASLTISQPNMNTKTQTNIDNLYKNEISGNAIAKEIGDDITNTQTNAMLGNGNIIFSSKNFGFTFKRVRLKAEFAEKIDSFFTMYGYACKEVKQPSIHNRSRWTYVKTIDCTLNGNIPNNDADKICSIYNNGITFWVNPSEVGNYSLENLPLN